jgi:hypothetical protein
MTEDNIQHYRAAQTEVLLQSLSEQQRFHVLDMHNISKAAPGSSAADGIHYVEDVYDAAAQVLLNMVAMEAPVQSRTCDNCEV